MKERFRALKFHDASDVKIQHANAILEEYGAQGYKLTLRQLYYKFVSRNLCPNNQKEYKKLGELINNARLAGLIDWDAIVDHTRTLRGVNTHDSPADIIASASYGFHRDLWEEQKHRIEVWIEKDAAQTIVSPVCRQNRIDFFSCRGYTGQSAMYEAGKRLARYVDDGKTPVILHFGDHDPSGIDMSRDIQERVREFARDTGKPPVVEFIRCALNLPQVQQYHCPENPAKETDSRCAGYVELFGHSSWELDALEPAVVTELINHEVSVRRDEKEWAKSLARETEERDLLSKTYQNWSKVAAWVKKLK